MKDQWQHIVDELLKLRDLGDDWDGQGAQAVEPENVDSAIEWIQRMRTAPEAIPPSQVAPGVAGEVVLVWQEDGIYLEAEISTPDRIEWMYSREGEAARHWTTDTMTAIVTSNLQGHLTSTP